MSICNKPARNIANSKCLALGVRSLTQYKLFVWSPPMNSVARLYKFDNNDAYRWWHHTHCDCFACNGRPLVVLEWRHRNCACHNKRKISSLPSVTEWTMCRYVMIFVDRTEKRNFSFDGVGWIVWWRWTFKQTSLSRPIFDMYLWVFMPGTTVTSLFNGIKLLV